MAIKIRYPGSSSGMRRRFCKGKRQPMLGASRRDCTVMLVLLTLSALVTAQKKDEEKKKRKEHAANLPAVIWRDPGEIPSLNLLYGAGGKDHAPDPNGNFVFVKEDLKGTSPKFDVRDQQGVEWKVKLGQEPQSETAASRLMWAAGYFVDEDYYPQFQVTD